MFPILLISAKRGTQKETEGPTSVLTIFYCCRGSILAYMKTFCASEGNVYRVTSIKFTAFKELTKPMLTNQCADKGLKFMPQDSTFSDISFYMLYALSLIN